MDFWDKVKTDIQRGIKEGVGLVREGVAVVREKAEELTEEGRKRLRIFELQTKVQKEVTELGGKVYDLKTKVRNPMSDKKVQTIIGRIKKLETQILKLEGSHKAAPKKTARKRSPKTKKTPKA